MIPPYMAINHFQNPWLLLLLPVPLLLLVWQLSSARRAAAILYSDLTLLAGLPVTLRQRALGLLPWMRCGALCLGVVALARPQFGIVEMRATSLGVDIAIVMDVSGSMQEQDYAPNRLEAAKAAASSFVEGRKTDRVTVVIFGESAAVLCPPTMDMGAAKTFIAAIGDGIIRNQATAVGDGLALGVSKLKDSKAKSRVAILLTDGESNSGKIKPLQAAEIAKALNVRVYSIGVGRSGGRRGLPFVNPGQGAGFDDSDLRAIAERTGGKYFLATDERTLKNIYEEIDRLEKTEIEVQESTDFEERFLWFWYPALVLLGLEFLLRALWLRRIP